MPVFSCMQRRPGGPAGPLRPASGEAAGFTLIELILVMALLTIAVSVTAPTLSRFFRGRALDSEARQLLALTRQGQSRAASEGLPVDLWINTEEGKVGLEIEPSFETTQAGDAKGMTLDIDPGVKIEAGQAQMTSTNRMSRNVTMSLASVPKVKLVHANLPTIRFLPDGTVAESSPLSLHLTHSEGGSLWVAMAANRLSYEIREKEK